MKNIIKKFNELNLEELYEILKIRSQVFVLEQECLYQDLDNKDKQSYHLYIREEQKVIAYCRILEKGVSYKEISIGRVLVDENYRGKKIAKELLQNAINFVVNDLKEESIRISAQAYLIDFYKSLGFKTVSELYLEDNIPHIEMLYTYK